MNRIARVYGIFICLVLVCTVHPALWAISPKPPDITSGRAEITAPSGFISGQRIPLVVRFYNSNGLPDESITGNYRLSSSSFNFDNAQFKVFRGVGVHLTRITGSGTGAISVEGYDDQKTLEVLGGMETVNYSGTLNGDQRWSDDRIHLITGNLTIPQGVLLTIDEGAVVLVRQDRNIIVNGDIRIEGSPDNPVFFTAEVFGQSWGGIELKGGNDRTNLNHVFFSQGGGDKSRAEGHSESQPVLYANDTDLRMSNAYFVVNEGKAILTNECINLLESLVVYKCDTGIELRYSNSQLTGIHISYLPDDDWSSIDDDNDGIYLWSSLPGNPIPTTVRDCVVHHVEDDAIDVNEQGILLMESCVVSKAYDKGLSSSMESTVTAKRSLFIDCDEGVVVKDGSEGYLENLTLYNNKEGLTITSDVRGSGKNLILNNSSQDVYSNGAGSRFPVTYSISDEEVISGTGNIRGSAMLINPGSGLFGLQAGSPAIDSGDPNSPPDPDGTRCDMGAVPFNQFTSTQLILSEISYAPVINGTKSEDYEFIELYNPQNRIIELNGFRFDAGIEFTFPTGAYIDPLSFVVVVKNRSKWSGIPVTVYEWTSGSLNDNGETLRILNNQGETVVDFTYGASGSWPVPATFHHYTLELKDLALSFQQPGNWQLSFEYGGTPGRINRRSSVNLVSINELMAKNDGLYQDETGNFGDWIEIFNNGTIPVNLAGLYLTNSQNNKLHQIGSGNRDATTLLPGSYMIFWADDRVHHGLTHLNFTLSSSGGTIVLSQDEQSGTRTVNQLVYPAIEPNISFGRFPDGSNSLTLFQHPTPGGSNKIDSPGLIESVYINEFVAKYYSQYPDEHGDITDWIELYNAGNEAVDVGGLYITDNLQDPDLYKIPIGYPSKTTIAPKGFLILRADANPAAGPLHLDFQLASAGEQIGLVQNFEGRWVFIDSLTYPRQLDEISYGRATDGGLPWRLFWTPTPNSSNNATAPVMMTELNSGLRVFPNPASNFFKVERVFDAEDEVRVTITDLTGKLVAESSSTPERVLPGTFIWTFERGSAYGEPSPDGVYLVQVITLSGCQHAKVIFSGW